MTKFLAALILLAFILTIAILSLSQIADLGKDHNSGITSPVRSLNNQSDQILILQATSSAKATATFGAEQFHLQLTAIAGENQ